MPEKQIPDVILDSIADGVFTVDENWQITSFNSAATQITGVPREEAIGRRCCDVFHASICENECALGQTLETGRSITCKPIYVVKADGNRIPISISTAILKDHDGKLIGGVETFRDLSVVEQLRKELEEKYTFADIIARSAVMRKLLDVLPQFGESNSTVLIEGASGTGKELFARAIHDLSHRRDRPLVAVNCGALPDTLLESELFGYEAGAFTDARHDKPGRFALADGGTIFLDEIGDVSPAMQSKLLRVLQEGVYEPLGSIESANVDVRVIAATNKDLSRLVSEDTFREDLYYRINIVRLQLPPLCDRREDLPLLVEHFLRKMKASSEISKVPGRTMDILIEYDWPGNVRELRNVLQRYVTLGHLEFLSPGSGSGNTLIQTGIDLREAVHELEKSLITRALHQAGGNRTQAASLLGISRRALFRKMATP